MKKATIAASVAATALVGLLVYFNACRTPSPWPPHDGDLRQSVELSANGLRRGGEGTVSLTATAHYTTQHADRVESVTIARFGSLALSLVDAAKKSTPITAKKWESNEGRSTGTVTLPEVPDGDYTLHATYTTRLGAGELDVPLPLYTPARIHVITDRPLYEPGNLVRFRAVVLRARDLAPLDGRPGRWIVTRPDGEVLLEEKAPAAAVGRGRGHVPARQGRHDGDWKVAWVSADAPRRGAVHRRAVHAAAVPRRGGGRRAVLSAAVDKPVIRGAVIYSSGAPVANAKLDDRVGRRRRLAAADRVGGEAAAEAGQGRRQRPLRARAAGGPGGSAGQGDADGADRGGRCGG